MLEIHPRICMGDDKMDPGFFSVMPHNCSSEGSFVVFLNINDVANFCNQYICGTERIGKTLKVISPQRIFTLTSF